MFVKIPLSLENVMPHLYGIPQQFTCKYLYLYLSLASYLIKKDFVYHLPNIRSLLITINE